MKRLLLAPALLLAGCASSTPPPLTDDHPARTEAPAAPRVSAPIALAPVPQPDLPAALRPDTRLPGEGVEGMDRARTDHAQKNHGQMASSPTPGALPAALDAYLAVQEALAADQFNGLAAHAQSFGAAFSILTELPLGDDPHFWHSRTADTKTIRTSTQALAEADDLSSAREAFGELSLPFANLVEAAGVPQGYDLTRLTCGMAEAPEGGVWLQHGEDTRNPYFGSAMLTCGSIDTVLPADAMQMDTMEEHDVH